MSEQLTNIESILHTEIGRQMLTKYNVAELQAVYALQFGCIPCKSFQRDSFSRREIVLRELLQQLFLTKNMNSPAILHLLTNLLQ